MILKTKTKPTFTDSRKSANHSALKKSLQLLQLHILRKLKAIILIYLTALWKNLNDDKKGCKPQATDINLTTIILVLNFFRAPTCT